ncbi:MAG: sigma-70 family RNA polymerase sigma factor [Chitinophagaceae bacterium]|nr:sigma-70 family RNA polymerase sigma factor [Chitinophagaceae bacterium]
MPRSTPYLEKIDLPLIADGDEKAFYEFYTHYSNRLRPFLLKYTRSESHVEDILQETFIRVWVNRDRLPEIENIAGWIFRIASRVYLDHVDRELKHRERKDSFGEALHGSGLVVSAERTRLQEINNCIRKVLNELPEQKRKVFRLNRELGMKPSQIADQLSIPVGTVKNQLSMALREIREELIANGYGPVSIFLLFTLLSLKDF